MLTDSIALAPSSTTTAFPVATTRSAPCGGFGSWAVLMRMRSPGERAGHEAAVRDGLPLVGHQRGPRPQRPHYRRAGIGGNAIKWQSGHRAPRNLLDLARLA